MSGRAPAALIAGVIAGLITIALSGCAVSTAHDEPTGPVPSSAEIRSLLGATGGEVGRIAGDRADVMIDVTSLVTDAAAPSEAADVDQMTIVAACVLSKSSGGPHGFATGVIPTSRVTPAIRAKAVAGEYRSLLGENCAPEG